MPIFNKSLILFSVLKAALISLAFLLVEVFDDFFEYYDWLLLPLLCVVSLVFIFLGYFEFSPGERYKIHLSTTLASVLLLLNPTFWGVSGGHPALPNMVLIPAIFLVMLVMGMIGGSIAKPSKKRSTV